MLARNAHLADGAAEVNKAALLGYHRGLLRCEASLGPRFGVNDVGAVGAAEVLIALSSQRGNTVCKEACGTIGVALCSLMRQICLTDWAP